MNRRVGSTRFLGIFGILLFCILLSATGKGNAQDIRISPLGWDYGNVVVGTSENVTFDLMSLGPTAVWVYVGYLNEYPDFHVGSLISPHYGEYTLGAFSFDTYPILPIELPMNEHIQVDILFTPPSPGDYSVYLLLETNDSDSLDPWPGRQAILLLEGTGVETAIPEPSTYLLLGSGLAGLAACRLRWRKS